MSQPTGSRIVGKRLARRALSTALAAAFGAAWGAPFWATSGPAAAQLPAGAQVVKGSADIATANGGMTITNSPNAVLNWQSFSIGLENRVHFQQQAASSKVLNRVVGNDPSHILGQLSSNGEVWLVNPHGVLFGANARVDVGALVASTLAVSDEDFGAGRLRFEGSGVPGGQVLNEGEIGTSFGGRVWLMGDAVRNSGVIRSPAGQIVLAAGKSIELVDSGMPNVAVRIMAPENAAVNLGSLLAPDGGSIDVHGAMVNQQGVVRADSVGTDASGRIVIRARGDLHFSPDSVTSASTAGGANDNAAAGRVLAESSEGMTTVLGTLAASSTQGTGGRVDVLGNQVLVFLEALVDASGATGGGQVHIGGRGQGPGGTAVMGAYLGPAALVRANATASGDGGTVSVRSSGDARLEGSIAAQGGQYGGKGGRVDTSAQRMYAQFLAIDVGAADRGDAGAWLLASGGLAIAGPDNPYAETDRPLTAAGQGNPFVSSSAVNAALATGAHVTLRASGGGPAGQAGDIVVAHDIRPESGAAREAPPAGSLSLEAHKDILVDAGVTIDGHHSLGVRLRADSGGNGTGAILLRDGAAIDAGTGNIAMAAAAVDITGGALRGGSIGVDAGEVALTDADLQAGADLRIAGAGRITLQNTRLGAAIGGDAITLSSPRLVNTASELSAPNGRWLIYLGPGLAAFPAAELGNLDYTFVQVDGAARPTPAVSGAGKNGVIMADPLAIRARVDAGRSYDGTERARFSQVLADDALPGFRLQGATTVFEGRFQDKHAGAGKPILYEGEAPAFAVVTSTGRPVYGARLSYSADIAPLSITHAGLAAADKVYDGTRTARIDGSLSGILAGDQVALAGATGLFDTKEAGAGKPVAITGGVLSGRDAANYVLGGPAAASAAVTHRPLDIVITGEVRKQYDGSASASLATTQYLLAGAIANDALAVKGPAQGSYDSPDVGQDKGVSTTGSFEISGADAANYRIGAVNLAGSLNLVTASAGGKVGSITPAPVAEVERPPAPRPAPQPPAAEQRTGTAALDAAVRAAMPALIPHAGAGGLLDRSASIAGGFDAVDIGAMDQDELAYLLARRREFKRRLFADAVHKLDIDPSLADVRPCATVVEADTGACRLTGAQLELIRAAKPPAPAIAAAAAQQARARTASVPQIARKVAILFGINDYADKEIPTLENAISDANVLGQVLADRLGYEVRVLRNPGKAEIIRTLNALAAEVDAPDSVVIFFAGHGHSLEKGGAGYWLASDAAVANPQDWISNSDIARLLSNVRASQVTLISDSCYSGLFAREGLGAVGQNVTVDQVLAKRSVVVLSAGGDEPVPDEGKAGHSIFTWHLIQVMKSVSSWTPGSRIFTDVQARVRKELPQTPRYSSVTAAGHQAGGDYLFELRSR
ncbi:MAG: YDG domain-containing protein [Telluria sp.]